jgi:superfamily II DNA or RNA helicase
MSMMHFDDLMRMVDSEVSDHVDDLGRELEEDYAVNIMEANDGFLSATVDTLSREYRVKITWTDSSYRADCTCGKSMPCEHVWATLLTAYTDSYYEDAEAAIASAFTAVAKASGKRQKAPPTPRWKEVLNQITGGDNAAVSRSIWPAGRELIYVIDREATFHAKGIVVELNYRERKKDGQWSKLKEAKLDHECIAALSDGADRTIVSMLAGAQAERSSYYGYYGYGSEKQSKYTLTGPLARAALPAMCRTGRCYLRPRTLTGIEDQTPQSWGADVPWALKVEVSRDEKAGEYHVEGVLEREGERRLLTDPVLLTPGGLVFWGQVIEEYDDRGAFDWARYLRSQGRLIIPENDGPEFSRELYARSSLSAVQLPDDLRMEEVRVAPRFYLKIHAPKKSGHDTKLRGDFKFGYEDQEIDGNNIGQSIIQADRKRVILRDPRAEAEAHARLHSLGWRQEFSYDTRNTEYLLTPSKLAKVVATLVREGWHVEADGKLYRQPGELRIEVNSGIDWFELHGEVQFGDQVAKLPQLLAALRKGEHLITLGDGTTGMLPEEWLKKYGVLAGMGKEKDDHLRFTKSQVGLLDALLAAQPQATFDGVFEKTRQMLRSFDGIDPAEPPETFTGELRPYQKDGLGWLKFLREFSFGGCLADDMGLGKTVQVLGMLLARKEEIKSNPRPSLVVVPRSLIFNWMEEARRFAPGLKIVDHSHSQRTKSGEHLADYDVVLTTYGTLRNDAVYLKDIEFDYLILDESQAIKNAASESAKAARLLQGNHRLALSGTPVQNHLGDLWSLFDFLNPGMLGTSSVLNGATALTKSLDQDTKLVLAKALRPFILRRTKEQVAKDLPAKMEQTIYCELDKTQRKNYNELKEYYRKNLLELVATQGMNKAKIQILEALLRLRQAACHPGLIDKKRTADSSAKLDMLIPRLVEIAEEGHKALVFSQFTSFLSIVKSRLDKEKIKYEYLDGKTKDRQARVDHFQSDPKLKLFLISLKAGGVGLNLTAADYVFLLDPWWNPAVEAQAIDRTHRIGQTRQVFACRLIAKDTVEEKVLELQNSKRQLAEAIINGDNSVISSLGREELELLLS